MWHLRFSCKYSDHVLLQCYTRCHAVWQIGSIFINVCAPWCVYLTCLLNTSKWWWLLSPSVIIVVVVVVVVVIVVAVIIIVVTVIQFSFGGKFIAPISYLYTPNLSILWRIPGNMVPLLRNDQGKHCYIHGNEYVPLLAIDAAMQNLVMESNVPTQRNRGRIVVLSPQPFVNQLSLSLRRART
jgi:hypothetical protein